MSASVTGSGGSALLARSPAWTSDPIVVAADETLTLRVSVSSVGASSAPTAGLVYLDALGQVISTDTLITAPLATEGFRMLESDVAVPADVVAVQVRLAGFSPLDGSASGRVAFDDVGLFGR